MLASYAALLCHVALPHTSPIMFIGRGRMLVGFIVGVAVSVATCLCLFKMSVAWVDTLGIGEKTDYNRVRYFDGPRLRRLLITDSEMKRIAKRSK